MIKDRRKLTTKMFSMGFLVSISNVGINPKSFSWPVHSIRTRNLPTFSATSDAGYNTVDNADITQSQTANTIGLVECRK